MATQENQKLAEKIMNQPKLGAPPERSEPEQHAKGEAASKEEERPAEKAEKASQTDSEPEQHAKEGAASKEEERPAEKAEKASQTDSEPEQHAKEGAASKEEERPAEKAEKASQTDSEPEQRDERKVSEKAKAQDFWHENCDRHVADCKKVVDDLLFQLEKCQDYSKFNSRKPLTVDYSVADDSSWAEEKNMAAEMHVVRTERDVDNSILDLSMRCVHIEDVLIRAVSYGAAFRPPAFPL